MSCGTTPEPVLFEPEAIPDPKPVEAMQKCDEILSQLPVDFSDLSVREAIDILAKNRAFDAAEFWECATKHEDLVRWIEKQ